LKNPDEWQRKSLGAEKKTHIAEGRTRKWGATMGPQSTVRKVNYEIEVYKNFAGANYGDDSVDSDKPATGEDTTSALEPLVNEGMSGAISEIARVTITGVNSWWKTYFFLVKGFLGSGMLTLTTGYCNGGILFSLVCMAAVCCFSIMGMTTLLDVRKVCGGSFSDIAGKALGKFGRVAVDVSLAFCQVL